MLAPFVTFVDLQVHTMSFNILHHVLRIMDEIEISTSLGARSFIIDFTRKAQKKFKKKPQYSSSSLGKKTDLNMVPTTASFFVQEFCEKGR